MVVPEALTVDGYRLLCEVTSVSTLWCVAPKYGHNEICFSL